jgi:maleate cis-trans isomerase
MVKRITPIPASTVLTAVNRGLCSLNMNRVVMVSPFREDQDVRLSKFLAYDEIEVVAHKCDLASALLCEYPNVDGVYMSCNKWRITSVVVLDSDRLYPMYRERFRQNAYHQHAGVDLGCATEET